MYKHLFGPVNSRRLGRSLGVDLVPFKYCSYDCIYCQLGATTHKTIERTEFVSTREVFNEIKRFLSQPEDARRIDVISLAGSGEPTLAANMGQIIRWIKDVTPIPVAVLTNSSLMWMEDVLQDLLCADIVMPSVDALSPDVFEKINRHHSEIDVEKIKQGLLRFSQFFKGRLYPEVLILKGYNDSDEEMQKLAAFLQKLHPDTVHLNVAERPVTTADVKSPSVERMNEIKAMFPPSIRVEVVGKAPNIFEIAAENEPALLGEKIVAHLRRRPGVPADLAQGIGVPVEDVYKALEKLTAQGRIEEVPDRTDNYYYVKRGGKYEA